MDETSIWVVDWILLVNALAEQFSAVSHPESIGKRGDTVPTPTTFVAQIKDLLDHLYDLAYLSECPLGRELLPARLPTGVSRAHALRQALVDAIDELHQDLPQNGASRPGRTCHILDLRYVESLSYREVMSELGLSQPQYHREQRRAIEALATLLWEKCQRGGGQARREVHPQGGEPRPQGNDAWTSDLQAVTQGPEVTINLRELVTGVVALLTRVAQANEVTLHSSVPEPHLVIDANRTVLRQLLIAATSFILHWAQEGDLAITSTILDSSVRFEMVYRGKILDTQLHAAAAHERWEEGEHLLTVLNGAWTFVREADGARLSISLPGRIRTLLVIDDNPDMIQMITRCVSGQGYVVTGASTMDEGIALAKQQHPNVIILDIMMPGRDGWDALQALKNHPATQDVPVLVCTILAESELALALGAQGFLRKPITRPRLLESLQSCTG